MEKTIPTGLDELLKGCNIRTYKIIEYNAYKGRYCLECNGKEGVFILKWNATDDLYTKHLNSLCKERSIMHHLKNSDITPKLLLLSDCDGDNYFATEKVGRGLTLRNVVKELYCKGNIYKICNILKSTFAKWNHLIMTLEGYEPQTFDYYINDNLFRRYMSSLLCSGPFESSIYKIERFRNIMINQCLRLCLKRRMNYVKFLQDKNKILCHGDFHANNVLIDKSEPYFIDLEDVRYGVPEIELAYLYVQICCLVNNNMVIRKEIDEFIKRKILAITDMNLFWDVFELYFKIIRLNHRFL